MRFALSAFTLVSLLTLFVRAKAQDHASASVSEQKAVNVIGLAVRTNNKDEAGGNGEIPKLWMQFMHENVAAKIPNRADQDLLAVYTDYEKGANGEYTYLLAARVTSSDDVPAGLTLKEIPAGRYAAISTEEGPLSVVIPKVWQRIYSLPATELGGERAFQADYEVYPQGFDSQDAQIKVYIGLK